MAKGKFLTLKRAHKTVTRDLADLNRELALQMLVLAKETGDIEPLIGAVKALGKTQILYTIGSTTIETAHIQKRIGDVLLGVGRREKNMRALDYAIIAYRGAITISSLLGAQGLRSAARKNCNLASTCRGLKNPKSPMSLMGAA